MDLSLAPVSWQPVLRVQDLMKEQFALLLSFVLEFYKILEMGQDKPLIDKKKEKSVSSHSLFLDPLPWGR